jgi:allantoicase/CubicO group peptidase (beta-lactamase class C family)
MDDLATAERSRWEVWHEIYHGRFSLESFLKIAHEEMLFIRKDLSNEKKIVQVKWDERTEKWYPIAFKLMIQLMTSPKPPEFAPELLLPFTIDSVRNAADPWKELEIRDPRKYAMDPYIERFNFYFSVCGNRAFAQSMAGDLVPDISRALNLVEKMDLAGVIEAARFHGDIGEPKKTLDKVAASEQKLVQDGKSATQVELRELGEKYLHKHGVKFLISAQGKSAEEILVELKARLQKTSQEEFLAARSALSEITRKRLTAQPAPFVAGLTEKIQGLLKKYGVVGAEVTVSMSAHRGSQTLCFGEAVKGEEKVNELTQFEIASLSKAIASCFAIEYFKKRNISLDMSVNSIFKTTPSRFRIRSLNSSHPEWADQVTLRHLMSHSALNMHYVKGVRLSQEMPDVLELLNGSEKYGYEAVGVVNAPGTKFQYSGGGFLVLQHLLESFEKKQIAEITEPFLRALGLRHLSFDLKSKAEVATGYLADGKPVPDSRFMFPAFAAGGLGTSADVALFLEKLASAYHSIDGCGPISHDTAVVMLHGSDFGSREFMGCDMGLGLFTIEAGSNRFAIHQGANDGYRCLFLHCYDGPDVGKGLVVFCNADSSGVLFISEVAQAVLSNLNISGVNQKLFNENFDSSGVPQAELVNRGYKDLIFSAFEKDLPESILREGTQPDPLATYNLAIGGLIQDVSNQKFARGENLLSDHLPVFDPELYGRQGKIMDSWESVRHNPKEADTLTFRLKIPSAIHFVSLSTQFHLGNQGQAASVEGRESESSPWQAILPKTPLDGHAIKYLKASSGGTIFREIKVSMFPDGGLSRLGLYGDDLSADQKNLFREPGEAKSHIFKDAIPHSARPLVPRYAVDDAVIRRNWASVPKGAEVDFASAAFGGKIVRASNEHYGPAAQIISPYPPLNMFDGFESARSRDKNHFEEVVIELGRSHRIQRIEIDFTYFKNNNPREISIQGLAGEKWIPLVETTNVKAYAGNFIEFKVERTEEFKQIKIIIFPDGGLNRVRVFGVC